MALGLTLNSYFGTCLLLQTPIFNDVLRVAQQYGTIAHTPGAVRPSSSTLYSFQSQLYMYTVFALNILTDLNNIFSSPEPKAPGELIV